MDLVVRIISLPVFLTVAGFFVYLPGFFLVSRLKQAVSIGEQTLFSFCFGFLIVVIFSMVAGLAGYPLLAIPLVGGFSWLGLRDFKRSKALDRLRLIDCNPAVIAVNGLGLGSMGWFIFRGAIKTGQGIYYAGTSYHDSLWHLSLIAELRRQFPPQVPTIAGHSLKNYHYFSDIVTAFLSSVMPFSVRHVYFFTIPFFIILLVGLSVWVVTRRLTDNPVASLLALIFTYVCGSFAYLLPLFYGPHFAWQESSFWVSQTVSMAQNPPFLFSIPILFSALILLSITTNFKAMAAGAVLVGMLVGFKVYACLVGLLAIALVCLWSLLVKRQFFFRYLGVLFTATAIAAIVSTPLRGAATGSLFIFQPLWYLRAMVEHSERVPINDWVLREDTYRAEHNVLRIIQLQTQELAIFVVGNLGIRVVGFAEAVRQIWLIKRTNPLVVLLLATLMPAGLLPLLFVQSGVAAATIQFWYYVLLVMNIFAAITIAKIVPRLTRWRIGIVALVILLALPTTVQNILINRKGLVVLAVGQYQALRYLATRTPKNAVILTPADVEQLDKAYVAAFSERRTYYTYNQIAEITKIPIEERKVRANEFFSATSSINRKQFLMDNQIDYVFDPVGNLNFALFGLQPIYQNKSATVYQYR